jgi:hypothetical protein
MRQREVTRQVPYLSLIAGVLFATPGNVEIVLGANRPQGAALCKRRTAVINRRSSLRSRGCEFTRANHASILPSFPP